MPKRVKQGSSHQVRGRGSTPIYTSFGTLLLHFERPGDVTGEQVDPLSVSSPEAVGDRSAASESRASKQILQPRKINVNIRGVNMSLVAVLLCKAVN